MNIAIIGAGAMGLLYGAYLSQENQVYLVCTREEKANLIQKEGVHVTEKDGSIGTYHPHGVVDTSALPKMDVVILFVKAGQSEQALQENTALFHEDCSLLTLQNGAGHEKMLGKFVKPHQIALGISQDGSFLLGDNQVRHTGSGRTYFGKPQGDTETLAALEATCIRCGFRCEKSADILRFIWEKLMINASSSVLSGILQVEQGYCYSNPHAWGMIQTLVQEMVAVAKADGISLDYQRQIQRVKELLTVNPEGVPSIVVDLRQGRLTEVDTISGSVVAAGERLAVPTPTHSLMVQLVHAMEGR